MAKFSTLSLTNVPSLPTCPTKLRTTFSLGYYQLQVLPIKFRHARQQFNKGRNMRTASTTITGNRAPDDFPTFTKNGDLQDTDYTELCAGLFMKYTNPKGGDRPLKDGQKVEVKYSIFNQKRARIKTDMTEIITVGEGDLGPGFDVAIRRMSTGEKAVFVIDKKLWPGSRWQKVRMYFGKEDRYDVYKVTSVNIMN